MKALICIKSGLSIQPTLLQLNMKKITENLSETLHPKATKTLAAQQ